MDELVNEATKAKPASKLRLLSLVQALTVTGPIKPMLLFSSLVRRDTSHANRIIHAMLTTRRSPPSTWSSDPLFEAAREAGIECLALPERSPLDATVLPKLMRLIESFSPNIVESHDYKSHLLFFLARLLNPRLRRLKWIAFHHGYTRTSLKVLAYQQLDKVTLRHADRVVTLCEPFAKLLVGRGVRPGNISIISNSVSPQSPPSTDLITATKAAFGLTGSNFVILAVGRLSAEKGQADLLAAISQMRDTGPPNIRVLIAGDGPDRRRLQRQAAPLGSAVIFTGHVRDPWPLYNIAQLFVLPSHSEGSPLAILEAMAARLPIVSTSVGGIPELLQDGQTALLVPPRSPAGLAQAITTMKADEALRLRLAKNALDAVKRHSPFAYTERLLSIYDSTT